MPTFDIKKEETTAFESGQTYLFKQYFDKDEHFQKPQQYYKYDNYRFEVTDGETSVVRQILDNTFYELKIADEPMDYCVVQDKQENSSNISRNSVANQRRGNYEICVRKDEISVRQAIEKGATRLEEADLRKENLQWENRRIIAEPVVVSTVDTSIFHNATLDKSLSNEY